MNLAFNDLLAAAATWVLAVCVSWGLLVLVAAALEAGTCGRLQATSWVACPATLRAILLTGLGAVLATVPAQASASPSAPGAGGTLPPPARPTGAAPGEDRHIVVRPGDALWRLAESRLPGSSPAAEVADLVERLHRRNREVIGPDPDLIRPGQRLVVPPLLHADPHPHPPTPEEHP